MSKVSVLIPAGGVEGNYERFLPHTVKDVLNKAAGDVEVIAVLDGYWPDPILDDDPRLVIIHHSKPMGMRASINHAARVARGDYLLKCDAHCLFAEGYDEVLKKDCDQDWIVIPRRYSLDAENWAVEQNRKPPRDYHYLCYPDPFKDHDVGMHGVEWWDRGRDRSDPAYDIDDNMSFQGSCWFMSRRHFHDFLGGMSEEGYGTFTQEPQEIGNKTWLGGGAIKVNKKTWYAHLHKGKRYGRMYPTDSKYRQDVYDGHKYSAVYWMTNSWKKRVHDLEWLIEKFSPVPTWSEDWQEMFRKWHEHYGV